MSRNALASFDGKQFINLTTFRKSGQPVSTPVWFVQRDGCLYVHTGERTGKAKRIRATGRAQVAPSDGRGKPLGEFVSVVGRQINDPQRQREIEAAFRRKYGWAFRALNLLSPLRRKRMGDPVILELTVNTESAGGGERGDMAF